MRIYFWCFCYLYIQDSTESAQVCERGGDGIRKDLEPGLFQGSPKAQPRYMHKAVGSNILSEFEETFLLKILNAFHSRQRFSCVKKIPLAVDKTQAVLSFYLTLIHVEMPAGTLLQLHLKTEDLYRLSDGDRK